MPGLEKLKEEIICPSSFSDTNNGNDNNSDVYKNGHSNNDNYANLDGLIGNSKNSNSSTMLTSKANSNSASKLGFKKKSSQANLKAKSDDPFRFAGDGVDFKAKLIGFQEVEQSKGDQMCQDAIQACKAIIKRKGEHKQRIIFNVSLDGLKIKDPNSGKILHSFPVSKVSFIAKDITDNRAFGLVYCVSEHEHHFYAIKTEKIADNVVFSIRDMFQIVYEMKKKQVEQAKQLQTQKSQNGREVINGKTDDETVDEVPVADLLDLETELENLEQGMQNIDKWNSFNEETTANGLSQSSMHRVPSSAYTATSPDSSSTWTSNSLSSSVNDPFADQIFSSSSNTTNSFSSSIGSHVTKESFVAPPPPPSISHHMRRTSQGLNGGSHHQSSTLFGPPSADPFGGFVFPNAIAADNGSTNGKAYAPPTLFPTSNHFSSSDPFDTSHVTNVLNVTGNGGGLANGQQQPRFFESTTVNSNFSNVSNATPRHVVASTPLSPQMHALSAANGPHHSTDHVSNRFPSVIQPSSSNNNNFNNNNNMAISSLSFEEYSPDKSVFSATSISSGISNTAPTFSSSVFNNAMNNTHVLQSFMGQTTTNEISASIDWGKATGGAAALATGFNSAPPNSTVAPSVLDPFRTNALIPPTSAPPGGAAMGHSNMNGPSVMDKYVHLSTLDGIFNGGGSQGSTTPAATFDPSSHMQSTYHSSLPHLVTSSSHTTLIGGGGGSSANGSGAFVENNLHNSSASNVFQPTGGVTIGGRDDPFAHLRQKPPGKRTINELRQLTASGPNLAPLEQLQQQQSQMTSSSHHGNFNNGHVTTGLSANRNNENSKNVLNSIITSPPAIPPRSTATNQNQPASHQQQPITNGGGGNSSNNNNYPMIPRPHASSNATGLRNGHRYNEFGGHNGNISSVKDPFADDFFA